MAHPPAAHAVRAAVAGLAGVLFVLGLAFVGRPREGARIFGLPPPQGAPLGYVRAIGLRDLALSLALLGAALAGERKALARLCGTALVIPLGDLALVAEGGRKAPLALHALSAGVLALLTHRSLAARRGANRRSLARRGSPA